MKVTVSVSTNRVGSNTTREIEVDDEEWASMTEAEREEFCKETMFEMISWDYTEN
jgi:hypothetical protein